MKHRPVGVTRDGDGRRRGKRRQGGTLHTGRASRREGPTSRAHSHARWGQEGASKSNIWVNASNIAMGKKRSNQNT